MTSNTPVARAFLKQGLATARCPVFHDAIVPSAVRGIIGSHATAAAGNPVLLPDTPPIVPHSHGNRIRPPLHRVTVGTDAFGLVVSSPSINADDLGHALRSAVFHYSTHGERASRVEIAETATGFTVRCGADLALDDLWRFLLRLQRDLVCGRFGLDWALGEIRINAAATDEFRRLAA